MSLPDFISVLGCAFPLGGLEVFRAWGRDWVEGENSAGNAMYLHGPPGGGKTHLVRLLCAVAGREQCAAVNLELLGKTNFTFGDLLGKRCVFADDISPKLLRKKEYILKSLAREDGVVAEKRRDPKMYILRGKMPVLLASNCLWTEGRFYLPVYVQHPRPHDLSVEVWGDDIQAIREWFLAAPKAAEFGKETTRHG